MARRVRQPQSGEEEREMRDWGSMEILRGPGQAKLIGDCSVQSPARVAGTGEMRGCGGRDKYQGHGGVDFWRIGTAQDDRYSLDCGGKYETCRWMGGTAAAADWPARGWLGLLYMQSTRRRSP